MSRVVNVSHLCDVFEEGFFVRVDLRPEVREWCEEYIPNRFNDYMYNPLDDDTDEVFMEFFDDDSYIYFKMRWL